MLAKRSTGCFMHPAAQRVKVADLANNGIRTEPVDISPQDRQPFWLRIVDRDRVIPRDDLLNIALS